jgi:Ras family
MTLPIFISYVRYVYDFYSAQYKPTVGVDLSSKILNIDGADFNVSFWDIVGADKAGSVAKVISFPVLVKLSMLHSFSPLKLILCRIINYEQQSFSSMFTLPVSSRFTTGKLLGFYWFVIARSQTSTILLRSVSK